MKNTREREIKERENKGKRKKERGRAEEKKAREKKGLRRESNPGHPHPKRVFYHLTTKPLQERGEEERV